jgi:hypothetical protein
MPGTDELASQFIYSINMPFQGLVGREPGLLALLLENKTLQITEFDALFINRTINVLKVVRGLVGCHSGFFCVW